MCSRFPVVVSETPEKEEKEKKKIYKKLSWAAFLILYTDQGF